MFNISPSLSVISDPPAFLQLKTTKQADSDLLTAGDIAGSSMKSCLLILLSLYIVCCHGNPNKELSPKTVTDSNGNYADEESQLTYAAIPEGIEYIVKPEEYKYQGLLPLINGMQGFVGISFGKETPWDTFLGLVDGSVSFDQATILELGKWAGGYAACLVIGFLFFLIFPIVGFCFCCCRCCCSNCGGKMMQKRDDNTSAWRCCYIITLFLSCTFLFCGMVCTYVTNERMSTLFSEVTQTVQENTVDLQSFGNNTITQINYVAIDGFNFTAKVMLRDLNNIGPIVGGAVEESLSQQAGIDATFAQLLALDPVLVNMITDLTDVENKKQAIKTSISTLDASMTQLATDIDSTFATCGATCGSAPDTTGLKDGTNFDPDSMPDFSSELQDLEDVQDSNLTGLVIQGQEEFDNISVRVETESQSTVQTITDMVSDFETVVGDALGGVSDMLTLFDSISNLTSTIGNLGNMTLTGSLTVDDLEKYRWAGGVALTCFVLLIFLLQLVGLVFGCLGCCCCGDKNSTPTERGKVSNCGGLLLMASVGLVFIFGSLIMLLVTLTYVVGAPLEEIACVNLRDPEYTIFKNLIDGGSPDTGPHTTILGDQEGYLLGDMAFGDPSIPLTVSGMLTDCENDKSAWEALYVDNFFNLNEVLDFKSTIDVDTEIDKISVDLSTIELISPDTKTELTSMRDAIDGIDFTGLKSELSEQTTNLINHIAELDRIEAEDYADVKTSQDEMYISVQNLESTATPVPDQINSLVTALESTQSVLQVDGEQIIKNESSKFAYRVVGVGEQYATFVNNTIRTSLGKCKPISNVYQSILVNTLCGSVIDSWNCVWFSLGWSIAFMVLGLILSVKLAKHIRIMEELHPDDPAPSKEDNWKYRPESGTDLPYRPPTTGKVHPI
ncbi:PROM1 [Bugula neritina]|uniref:PROM1 n=1 Tax=Bugula neritina TaxID=10212 RepID=A0A7J7JZC5_BUGNE|nr:PROM1 [Bugula neritina]